MKTNHLLILAAGLVLASCAKKESTDQVMGIDSVASTTVSPATSDSLLDPTGVTMTPGQFRYVAYDGTNTEVTFTTDSTGNKIGLRGGQLTLELPQVDSKDGKAIYRDHDIEVKAFGDSVVIEQEGNLFELKKARGQ